MKKRLKIFLALFSLTTIFVTTSVSAQRPQHWIGVTLAAMNGVERGTVVTKDIAGQQYNKTTESYDKVSYDTRAISVRTVGSKESAWISSPKGSTVTWDSSKANGNTELGGYYEEVKATKWTLTTVYYSGIWYLDSTGL